MTAPMSTPATTPSMSIRFTIRSRSTRSTAAFRSTVATTPSRSTRLITASTSSLAATASRSTFSRISSVRSSSASAASTTRVITGRSSDWISCSVAPRASVPPPCVCRCSQGLRLRASATTASAVRAASRPPNLIGPVAHHAVPSARWIVLPSRSDSLCADTVAPSDEDTVTLSGVIVPASDEDTVPPSVDDTVRLSPDTVPRSDDDTVTTPSGDFCSRGASACVPMTSPRSGCRCRSGCRRRSGCH